MKLRAYQTDGKINKLKRLSVIAEEGAWMCVGIKTAAKVSSQVRGETFFLDMNKKLKWTMASLAGISQVCEPNVYY